MLFITVTVINTFIMNDYRSILKQRKTDKKVKCSLDMNNY